MQRHITRRRTLVVGAKAAALVVTGSAISAFAKPPTTNPPIELKKWSGQIDIDPAQGLLVGVTYPFTLNGTASHLGNFKALGEIRFEDEDGGLVGDGFAVFKAANGDQLVGSVSWNIGTSDAQGNAGSDLTFHWLDSVTIGGKAFGSTGRFKNKEDRPPGLVVIAIIAVLIGLLLPAVQK